VIYYQKSKLLGLYVNYILDTSYDNISEVLSLLQRYKQKRIVHNGDNYTNTFYNMIYLNDNNKVSIKKNKVK
jgi:hypothetical protein